MNNTSNSNEKKIRIAIVDPEKCKPKKCNQECKNKCPVVLMGKLCVVVSKQSKTATISEELCNGCGICTKKCPFNAISIVNLPVSIDKETVHRYGQNGFKLHRLPMPKQGQILGLVGKNGTGKSTALKILANKLKPNLGNFNIKEDDPNEILNHFKGSELQLYFNKLYDKNHTFRTTIKPQYVDTIPKFVKGIVGVLLESKNERGAMKDTIIEQLDLTQLLEKDVSVLSGGELQRFAIALVALQNADCYMFDEPTSYLDVKQRLKAASVIRSIVEGDEGAKKYVVCVEHDLAILDYLSDSICMLYGLPSAYGIVSMPMSVTNGINIFLSGYLPSENMRFRDYEISFKFSNFLEEELDKKKMSHYKYPSMSKTLPGFKLNVEGGTFTQSEITVLLGENGTGKTTFIKLLAGSEHWKPDNEDTVLNQLTISYKPQIIPRNFTGTVRDLLQNKIKDRYLQSQFRTEVYNPLNIEPLLDLESDDLSGGELQRVAICLCLGKDADTYLIDEPSAYLDAEQRVETSKVIKRFILHNKKTAFIVEHDMIMSTYLADRVILFDGIPSKEAIAHTPETLLVGMNKFLKQLNITFRRDKDNWRPRINKLGSVKDTEQKKSGNYFFMTD